MKALLLRGPNEFAVVDRPDPQPSSRDAVIGIHRAGICATDMATIRGQSPVAVLPMTPGHEFIGRIEAIAIGGEFQVGDWVTIYPTEGCGACEACRSNRPNFCPAFRVWGVHRDGGCFAERMAVPVDQLLAVPPGLRGDAGALIEPTAVAAHAVRRAQLRSGQRVAVIGAGSIGLLIAQAVRAASASRVTLVDRLPERRRTAAALGFPDFVLAEGSSFGRSLAGAGGPFDIVFDNACTPSTIDAAVEAVSIGGTIVPLAFPHGDDPMTLPYPRVYRKELTIILSRNYAREDFVEAIELLERGDIEAERMITGTYPLSAFAEAYEALGREPEKHLKILIAPNG